MCYHRINSEEWLVNYKSGLCKAKYKSRVQNGGVSKVYIGRIVDKW
jgi:hypothetical protein